MKSTVVVVLLVGALTALPATAVGRDVCLPPGVTVEVLGWTLEDADLVTMRTESGTERAGVSELVQAEDGRRTRLMWIRGDLVYVDPAPDDMTALPWIDVALVSPRLRLVDRPGPPCRWQQVGGTEQTVDARAATRP